MPHSEQELRREQQRRRRDRPRPAGHDGKRRDGDQAKQQDDGAERPPLHDLHQLAKRNCVPGRFGDQAG